MFFSACTTRPGEDLGDYACAVPNWSAGDPVYEQGRLAYRVTALIPPDDLGESPYDGILRVEPVS